ncbi:unnamed protein product [Effrenium voratum]|uniref:SAP domain-containing protein n=1 Tax=Effrenium voratum TaxID=2562239 RepID=A0AA36IVF4_9DINO|nr:unnamed protein product [Effrenium voratum]CAJ1452092.1 unnamed protein product [Effrenium voratum]
MDALNAERSKLVQRQKQQRQEIEKKIKKLKGAMKEAAQKELEALETQHEAELADFNKGSAAGKAEAESKDEEPASASASAAEDAKKFRDRNWSGLSKKELEDECVARGLGKKGSKEDLVQKLIIFQQELSTRVANEAKSGPKGGYAAAEAKAAAAPADDDDDEEDDDDEDDDDDDEDDDEEEDEQEVDQEEMEKQGKREKVMQKAIRLVLKEKCPDGFPLSELVQKLESVNVRGFAPEKCGYKTVEKFVKGQPEAVLRYRKADQMVLPPRSQPKQRTTVRIPETITE